MTTRTLISMLKSCGAVPHLDYGRRILVKAPQTTTTSFDRNRVIWSEAGSCSDWWHLAPREANNG